MNIIVIINYFCIFFIKNIIVIFTVINHHRSLSLIFSLQANTFKQTHWTSMSRQSASSEHTRAVMRWRFDGVVVAAAPYIYRVDTQHKYHIMLTISRIYMLQFKLGSLLLLKLNVILFVYMENNLWEACINNAASHK